MKNTIIVDGYNAIHRSAHLERLLGRSLEAAREGLVAYCAEWISRRGDAEQFIVVFDGDSSVVGGSILGRPGIKVIYTATGESADDRILDIIRRVPDPGRRYVVVSDDNSVSGSARAMKMRAMQVSEFVSVLRAPASKAPANSRDDDERPLSRAEQEELNRDLRKVWGID